VDSAYTRSLGIETKEVSNGCFCCRYDELDVYNESWHTGVNTPASSANYWDRYVEAVDGDNGSVTFDDAHTAQGCDW